jgi:hypothetical protein
MEEVIFINKIQVLIGSDKKGINQVPQEGSWC